MTALKNSCTKQKSLSPIKPYLDWNIPELQWQQSDDNTWLPSYQSSTSTFDNWNPSDPSTYASTFHRNNLQVTRMSTSVNPTTSTPNTNQQFNNNTSSFINITDNPQSDMGANTNITNNLSLFQNVIWIKPIPIHSAKKEATMPVSAIGEYMIHENNTTLWINMYYSPDAKNTIISPTAIVQQFPDHFYGYNINANIINQEGHLTLLGHNNHSNLQVPLHSNNDLWYHQPTAPTTTNSMHVN